MSKDKTIKERLGIIETKIRYMEKAIYVTLATSIANAGIQISPQIMAYFLSLLK